MAFSPVQTSMKLEGDDVALRQLQQLDKKVQNRTIRKATQASGKEVLDEVKRTSASFKVTGFTARSLTSTIKAKKGIVTVKVGQKKQKKFKLRKRNRIGNKNLSNIQRSGRPVPIHWIERGTKPHFIVAPKGKRLAFQVGKRSKKNRALAFAKVVFARGMKPKHLLRNSARRARRKAAEAFAAQIRQGVKLNGGD